MCGMSENFLLTTFLLTALIPMERHLVAVDDQCINGDQMPLHRNESSTQKKLNIKDYETYVKENYSLSRKESLHLPRFQVTLRL